MSNHLVHGSSGMLSTSPEHCIRLVGDLLDILRTFVPQPYCRHTIPKIGQPHETKATHKTRSREVMSWWCVDRLAFASPTGQSMNYRFHPPVHQIWTRHRLNWTWRTCIISICRVYNARSILGPQYLNGQRPSSKTFSSTPALTQIHSLLK